MTPPLQSRWADLSSVQARAVLIVLVTTAAVGVLVSWNQGKLPQRDRPLVENGSAGASPSQMPPSQMPPSQTPPSQDGSEQDVAPDLQLYRDVVAAVAHGENYYAAAKPQLLKQGFPTRSTFNWRLPTYAWLFARLPGPWAIQGLLVILAAAGLVLHFQSELSAQGFAAAVISSLLMLGVVKWSVDGLAFYTQELWASVLILISLGAAPRKETAWRALFIAAGLAALFFRELALPYCFWAGVFAAWTRRWREALAWSLGIGCFFAFLYWHSQQVAAQLSPADLKNSTGGAMQWVKFGGLDFVLLTTRLNALLFNAPSPVLYLYLLASLFGLASIREERFTFQLTACASYLAAFCIVGMEVNFYWGLLYAPLLPAGLAAFPAAVKTLWTTAGLASDYPKQTPP
jgi:hypothetical protein